MAPQGTSFDMYTVTHFSTSAWNRRTQGGRHHLLTGKDGKLALPAASRPLPQSRRSKTRYAHGCGPIGLYGVVRAAHGMEGEGIPNVSPAMKAMRRWRWTTRRRLNVVLNGTPTQVFKNGERMLYAMPPSPTRLNAAEVADLVTWIRAEWGSQAVPVTVSR